MTTLSAAEKDWDLAQAQVSEPTSAEVEAATQAQLDIQANPRLAERTGTVSGLYASGMHEPMGTTTQPAVQNDFADVAALQKTPVQKALRHAVMTLEVGGHRTKINNILARMAGRCHEESIVVSRDDSGSNLKIEINVQPTRDEKAMLAGLGVKLFAQDGQEIIVSKPVKNAPRRDLL